MSDIFGSSVTTEKDGIDIGKGAERRKYAAGRVIYQEGELPDHAYFIRSGKIDVYLTRDNNDVTLATLQAGELFGEMALIDQAPRSASARAKVDSEVIVVTYDNIKRLMSKADPSLRKFLTIMIERLRRVNERLGQMNHESANAPTIHQM